MKMNVIITGATGMVGEGVLLECLTHPDVASVLLVNRKHYNISHPKVKELIVSDFTNLTGATDSLKGYDACFFCAGVSSAGMKESDYKRVTYDLTLGFAKALIEINPQMIFEYVSGSHTDSSEKGKIMWARVKGKTENDLMKLPFKKVYNFRPGFMKPMENQKNIKRFYRVINSLSWLLKLIMPGQVSSMRAVATAMILAASQGYSKNILEITDIKKLSGME